MIRWLTVEDCLLYQRPVRLECCTCDEREEGECICLDCWQEATAWREWMAEASDG